MTQRKSQRKRDRERVGGRRYINWCFISHHSQSEMMTPIRVGSSSSSSSGIDHASVVRNESNQVIDQHIYQRDMSKLLGEHQRLLEREHKHKAMNEQIQLENERILAKQLSKEGSRPLDPPLDPSLSSGKEGSKELGKENSSPRHLSLRKARNGFIQSNCKMTTSERLNKKTRTTIQKSTSSRHNCRQWLHWTRGFGTKALTIAYGSSLMNMGTCIKAIQTV